MNELDKLKKEIQELKGKLTGNMMEDMQLRDKIHNLEMKDQGDGFAELLSELGFTWNVMNITATYNF